MLLIVRPEDKVKNTILHLVEGLMGVIGNRDLELSASALNTSLSTTLSQNSLVFDDLWLHGFNMILSALAENHAKFIRGTLNHNIFNYIKTRVRTAKCLEYLSSLSSSDELEFSRIMDSLVGIPAFFEALYAEKDAQQTNHLLKLTYVTSLSISDFISTKYYQAYIASSQVNTSVVSLLETESKVQKILHGTIVAITRFMDPAGILLPTNLRFNYSNFQGGVSSNNIKLTMADIASSKLMLPWLGQFDFKNMPAKLNIPSIVMHLAMQPGFKPDQRYIAEGDNYYALALVAAKLSHDIMPGPWTNWTHYHAHNKHPGIKIEQNIYNKVGSLCTTHQITREFICKNIMFFAFELMEWNDSDEAPFIKAVFLFQTELRRHLLKKAAAKQAEFAEERAALIVQKQKEEEAFCLWRANHLAERTQTISCFHCNKEYQCVKPHPHREFKPVIMSQASKYGEGSASSQEITAESSQSFSTQEIDPASIYCPDCFELLCKICGCNIMQLQEVVKGTCNSCFSKAAVCSVIGCDNIITSLQGIKYGLCVQCIAPTLCTECKDVIKHPMPLQPTLCSLCNRCNECYAKPHLYTAKEVHMKMCQSCLLKKCHQSPLGQKKLIHSAKERQMSMCDSCLQQSYADFFDT